MAQPDLDKEFEFLKTLYESKLDDRKYFEDKALNLIQTNSILIVILAGLFSAVLPAHYVIPTWLGAGIVVVIFVYFLSAVCASAAIYPRPLPSTSGIASAQPTTYWITKLQDLRTAYEKTVLPSKAKWIKYGMIFFFFGILFLAIIMVFFVATMI